MKKINNEVKYRFISELTELEGNPRTITKQKMDKLVESIKDNPDYFEARPIICSDRTGKLVILAGNQRYKAAKIAGIEEVPVIILHGLTEEKEREIIIRDNVELGEWDMDILANEWDADLLKDWGVDINWDDIPYDEIVETASEGSIKDYDGDTNYDEEKFIRSHLSDDIMKKIYDGVESGKIRGSIGSILLKRAEQCTIFNFDEIIKFYRSEDASFVEWLEQFCPEIYQDIHFSDTLGHYILAVYHLGTGWDYVPCEMEVNDEIYPFYKKSYHDDLSDDVKRMVFNEK